jgi:DNA transposition AAA+ family ATPase
MTANTPGSTEQSHGSDGILDQLAEQARRLRVAVPLPEDALTADHVNRVRDAFNAFRQKYSLSLAKCAKRMGEGYSQATLHQFSAHVPGRDHFLGDLERITRGVNAWMERYIREQEARLPEGYVETAVARRMMTLIKSTIEDRTMGLIYADAGRGKTMVLQAASGMIPGAILLRIRQDCRSAPGLAQRFADALSLRNAGRTRTALPKIIDALRDSDRPLLIDEAHQLRSDALELLRDMHDECHIPIILAGTVRLNEAMSDSQEFFGQFNRRVGYRYDVTERARAAQAPGAGGRPGRGKPDESARLHSVEEIKALFCRGNVRLSSDALEMLAGLANILGLGGLGLCDMVVRAARRLSDMSGQIDATALRRVLRKMHGLEHVVSRIESRIQAPKLAATA